MVLNRNVFYWFLLFFFTLNVCSICMGDDTHDLFYFRSNSYIHSFERHDDRVDYQKSPILDKNSQIGGKEILIHHPFRGTVDKQFFAIDVDEAIVNKWQNSGMVSCFTYRNENKCCISWISLLNGISRGGRIAVPRDDAYYLPVGIFTIGDSDTMNIIFLEYENEHRNGTPRLLLYVNHCVLMTQLMEDGGEWHALRTGNPIEVPNSDKTPAGTRLAETSESGDKRAEKLAAKVLNSDIEWNLHKNGFGPTQIKNSSKQMDLIIDDINQDYDRLQNAIRFGNRENRKDALFDFDSRVYLNRIRLGAILLKQMEHEERWVAAHVLLSRLYRLNVVRTVNHPSSNGYMYYWNGIIVEQVIRDNDNKAISDIRIPNSQRQRKIIADQWYMYLNIEVPIDLEAKNPE